MTVRKIGETAVRSPLKRVALLLLAMLFFVSVTAFAIPPVMYDVTIYDGDSVISISTTETDAQKILEDAGINVNEAYGDTVSLEAFTGEDESAIIIKRGVEVYIESFDGTSHTVYASGVVSDAIEKAGITLPEGTALNYSADEVLFDGMTVEIYGIYTVTLTVDGESLTKKVSGKTVEDAVDAFEVHLSENDYTEPALTEELSEGMKVDVFRVTLKERTETEAVSYETEIKYSDSYSENYSKVLEDGVDGTKSVVYEDVYVNGEYTGSSVKSEEVITEAVNRVIQVGTKVITNPTSIPTNSPISEMTMPSYLEIGSNGIPTSYKSVINAKATAYCIPGGTTSTGKKAQTGYIAVDPNEIPYGTEMYIVSADGKYVYGYCIAADTGSYIYDVDWTVDLFMNSKGQCKNWGRRDIIIYVL